jgi:hypothetical protein
MEVVLVGEARTRGIAPFLGVEVEADDEIRTKALVDEPSAVADLGDSVEETLGFLLKALT